MCSGFNSIQKVYCFTISTNEYCRVIQVHNHKNDSGLGTNLRDVSMLYFCRRLKTRWMRRHRNEESNNGDISRRVVPPKFWTHYNDVIMGTIASQITSITIINTTVYSAADQRKYQSSASLVFVRGIHQGPVNSTHKWPGTRKMFPFDDVIMCLAQNKTFLLSY